MGFINTVACFSLHVFHEIRNSLHLIFRSSLGSSETQALGVEAGESEDQAAFS